MGDIKSVQPVMLFIGVLYSDEQVWHTVRQELERAYGSVCAESAPIDFTFTTYYESEMGSQVKRLYLAFGQLIDPGMLVDCKIRTNTIEECHARNGKRCVNLDPGYLELSKVVLATTKNFSHRLFLAKGIYGEVTLNWQQGGFTVHPWTYPDYKTAYAFAFFSTVRGQYKRQIQAK